MPYNETAPCSTRVISYHTAYQEKVERNYNMQRHYRNDVRQQNCTICDSRPAHHRPPVPWVLHSMGMYANGWNWNYPMLYNNRIELNWIEYKHEKDRVTAPQVTRVFVQQTCGDSSWVSIEGPHYCPLRVVTDPSPTPIPQSRFYFMTSSWNPSLTTLVPLRKHRLTSARNKWVHSNY